MSKNKARIVKSKIKESKLKEKHSGRLGLALGLIAIIIAAATTGYIGYLQFTGKLIGTNGEDGDDGSDGKDVIGVENIYYCSSSSQVQSAIDTIGSGTGTIMITRDITISQKIDIDQGGSYIIQSMGLCTITVENINPAFSITIVDSCTMKDLIIDASQVVGYPYALIFINEQNDNPVNIQNIQILGKGTSNAVGIDIRSNFVTVRDCYFDDITIGIKIATPRYCSISGNILNYVEFSIYIDGSSSNSIVDNIINHISYYGIYLTGNTFYNDISDNLIHSDDNWGQPHDYYGILLESNSDYNKIQNNGIYSLIHDDTGIGIGIHLETGSDYNVVTGNYLHYCDDDIINGPVTNFIENNYH